MILQSFICRVLQLLIWRQSRCASQMDGFFQVFFQSQPVKPCKQILLSLSIVTQTQFRRMLKDLHFIGKEFWRHQNYVGPRWLFCRNRRMNAKHWVHTVPCLINQLIIWSIRFLIAHQAIKAVQTGWWDEHSKNMAKANIDVNSF